MSSFVGRAVPRREGPEKVTGKRLYVDDLNFPGMWHGVTVRSPVARGLIREIRFEPGVPWDEIIIVRASDIPGINSVALLMNDQPALAENRVNHAEEPILLLAHFDRYLLEEARKHIKIEIDPLPAIFSIDDSIAQKEKIWGENNVFKSFEINKGNIDQDFGSDVVFVEGEYTTGAQEQLYIEPQGVIASYDAETGVTVWGSMQCPYYVQKALMPVFNLSAEKVRVIQMETGGGFGGKEEYPSMLAIHAALLARKSGKSVKIIYDRAEDMVATTKRHPSRTRHRTAVSREGKLLAMDIEFILDGGAYCTLSPVVLSRGTIHAAGPYFCPNVRVRSQAVATNYPPHGAFRGFGAPQSIFALERHMDRVAQAVSLAPDELRRRNFLKTGDLTATEQEIKEPVEMAHLMDRALEIGNYDAKRERYVRENAVSSHKRGIGFATFFHGAGFTGSGERTLASVVGVEATPEGKVQVLASSTEIGQGTNTIFSQIAADALGIDFMDIDVAQPDTAKVPNSGPTVASRTCMVVGKLVESACIGLRKTLIETGFLIEPYSRTEFQKAVKKYLAKHGSLKSTSEYKQPEGILWDDQKYRGEAYATYAWATYLADVSVDPITFEVKVEDFVAVQEVGKVVNPVLAAGQIEGGVAQAIGFALYEKVIWKNGRMANNRMTNYIMPTSMDLPLIRVAFEEVPSQHGPQGAKGIGELPLDGGAPAILNAISSALGVEMNDAPLMPEAIERAVSQVDSAV